MAGLVVFLSLFPQGLDGGGRAAAARAERADGRRFASSMAG
ncbi:MAG TPA: hypothetical protein VFW19_13945 [Allosphingosinicella sp.]|nr:hypothetical protein [Allosphingosinicella sp.]